MALTVDTTTAFTMDEMIHTPPAHKITMPDAPSLRRSSNDPRTTDALRVRRRTSNSPSHDVVEQNGNRFTFSPTSNLIGCWEQEHMHACMEWDRQQASSPSNSSMAAISSDNTAVKRDISDVAISPLSDVDASTAVHIQRDRTDSGRRITTTYEFPNCLYMSNLPEGITEVELTDLCHQTIVCRVDHVHITRTKADGHLIAFVYLVYWELDKLPTNMYNRLAEFKYVNFYYHPMGLPASTRLPPIHVQLARNKSQLHKLHQDKQQKQQF